MLPRLEAEKALQHVAEMQAADGWTKQEDRQDILRPWLKLARPEEAKRKPTKEEFMAQMAAIGFRIVV
jgi:hypothetical protein